MWNRIKEFFKRKKIEEKLTDFADSLNESFGSSQNSSSVFMAKDEPQEWRLNAIEDSNGYQESKS